MLEEEKLNLLRNLRHAIRVGINKRTSWDALEAGTRMSPIRGSI